MTPMEPYALDTALADGTQNTVLVNSNRALSNCRAVEELHTVDNDVAALQFI